MSFFTALLGGLTNLKSAQRDLPATDKTTARTSAAVRTEVALGEAIITRMTTRKPELFGKARYKAAVWLLQVRLERFGYCILRLGRQTLELNAPDIKKSHSHLLARRRRRSHARVESVTSRTSGPA